jgi:hypothetical protein
LDAAVIGLKEGLKLAVIWLVFYSYLYKSGKRELIRPFYIGLCVASLLVVFSFLTPPTLFVKGVIVKSIGYVFFLCFLASVGALYQSSGLNLFGPLRELFTRSAALWIVVAASTVVYFCPDVVGSSMFIRDVYEMKGGHAATYASAVAGFIVPLFFTGLLLGRVRGRLGGFFGIAQLLLFLAVIKLLGGGVEGFAELSLIPSVQRGVMKFVHDVVHQTFVFVMVPDHPLLKTTVWNFIGIFFGANIAMLITLVILLVPPLMFLSHSLLDPLPEPSGAASGAERRAYKAAVRADRRKKAVPAAIFVVVILVFWFAGIGGEVSRLYNPTPKPVVEDKGLVVIPLTDPTMDIMDGRIHKFAFSREGENIALIVVKKPDGKLAVLLDACEICSPEGYGQTEGHVVCIYCRTPIPVDTLGEPGGCNPIPLKARITDRDIRIEVSEILLKWSDVVTGKTREGIR